jgi:hypothetical protein
MCNYRTIFSFLLVISTLLATFLIVSSRNNDLITNIFGDLANAAIPPSLWMNSLERVCMDSMCKTQRLEGSIDDCMCDVEAVQEINKRHFYPLLSEIVKTNFFKYFKVFKYFLAEY